MPCIIFCTGSCGRLQLPLPGQFLSRRCFMLCITMEVEPRTAKQYKCCCCCVLQKYRGRVMEDGNKMSALFFGRPDCNCMHFLKSFFGILQHEQQVLACCQRPSDYRPSKMPLCKTGAVNFVNYFHCLPL